MADTRLHWNSHSQSMMNINGFKRSPGQDLMRDLRSFIKGATKPSRKGYLDTGLARIALSLLKTLPAAREAVLEYFRCLFDDVIGRYAFNAEAAASKINSRRGPPEHEVGLATHEEATVIEIHNVLCEFVSSSPEAWAPIISKWSLELLGELSSRYSKRAGVSGNLNESLQFWMSCRATRCLIDVTTQCLSCLMNSDTESCINALLDTCVAHSPHFDWVVAHVGSCFPRTVMTRVLSCGLKDFCCNQQGPRAPKLNSVVQILGYLANSHSVDMRRALLQLFQWSLEKLRKSDSLTILQQNSTVPFLLQLASMSRTLLRSLSTDVLHTLTPKVVRQLANQSADWLAYYGGRKSFQDLLVHLVLACPSGAPTILSLILNCAAPATLKRTHHSHRETFVQTNGREFLELLLQELSILLHHTDGNIPFLTSLRQELSVVLPLLLSPIRVRVQSALRLIGFMGLQSPSVFSSTIAFILVKAETEDHLSVIAKLLENQASTSGIFKKNNTNGFPIDHANILQLGLEQALHKKNEKFSVKDLWLNVSILLRWERSGKLRNHTQPVLKAIYSTIGTACTALGSRANPDLAHAVAETLVLALVQEPGEKPASVSPPSIQDALKLAHSTVSYFFMCMDNGGKKDLEGCQVACKLLSRLSLRSSAARSLALRTLLELALFNGPTHLFGARDRMTEDSLTSEETDIRLMEENLKQGLSWVLAQRHSSVFHAGVIGTGLRKVNKSTATCLSIVQRNIQLFIDAVRSCCVSSAILDPSSMEPGSPPLSLDAVISVSLLLVELISPDVMYNGLPWPDEDGSKATVERDCHIRRKLEQLPILWELLWFIALQRPALCYCSVLLRAITATLIAQWGSCSQRQSPALMPTTVHLLSILALGQLLPRPLSSLRDVVPHLRPTEVVQILRVCVWNYMHANVPSPALFSRDSYGNMWRDATQNPPGPQYTETMRLIMLGNIESLGELYAQLFND